jgi:hypothetical protein
VEAAYYAGNNAWTWNFSVHNIPDLIAMLAEMMLLQNG